MKQKVTFIVINCHEADPQVVKEILSGIEEEGTLFHVNQETGDMDSLTLSYNASRLSSVGVGIGVVGKYIKLSVQHQMSPVCIMNEELKPKIIGQNAARYIKGKPFIFP